ncbi:IS3 family transposase [Microbacterium sp.]|uniref:IS3 family transposase n=1 Tax=Microbacterium sp. TaxID=51671 RepID=UPI003A8D2CAF
MSSSSLAAVVAVTDDGVVSAPSNPDRPVRRRTFTPAQKLRYLSEYETACETGQGNAYLRGEGLYSSLISEWRKQRDAGVLEGKSPADTVGRLTREQAEIARLKGQLRKAEQKLATTEMALEIMGKAPRALGANLRERGHRQASRDTLMTAYAELTGVGVPTRQGAVLTGVPRATAARVTARAQGPDPEPAGPRPVPVNKLTDAERATVLAVLNSDEFVDKPPLQVYAILLERGQYVASVSTMYRVLAENRQLRERRRLATHPPRKVPELIATAPGQVLSWDITKLAGPVKGTYFDAYVMIDIFSRYIVGAIVHATEDGILAKEMMLDAFGIHGTPEVVHSDGGPSMTSKTVRTLLADLGVTVSRSRPHVSNDNPYSEALFKTMKYLPLFPDRFDDLAHARRFLDEFVNAYNHHHRHSGIGMHTPADVHYGLADAIDRDCDAALDTARRAHPERFSTRAQTRPKILDRDPAAWINQPPADELQLAA